MGNGVSSIGTRDGKGSEVQFGGGSLSVIPDPAGFVYIVDTAAGAVRRLDTAGNVLTTHRWTGGPGALRNFNVGADGQLYALRYVGENITQKVTEIVTWDTAGNLQSVRDVSGLSLPGVYGGLVRAADGSFRFVVPDSYSFSLIADKALLYILPSSGAQPHVQEIPAGSYWLENDGTIYIIQKGQIIKWVNGNQVQTWSVPIMRFPEIWRVQNGDVVVAVPRYTEFDFYNYNFDFYRIKPNGQMVADRQVNPYKQGWPGSFAADNLGGLYRIGNNNVSRYENDTWNIIAGSEGVGNSPLPNADPSLLATRDGKIYWQGSIWNTGGAKIADGSSPGLHKETCQYGKGSIFVRTGSVTRQNLTITMPSEVALCPVGVTPSPEGNVFFLNYEPADNNAAQSQIALYRRESNGQATRLKTFAYTNTAFSPDWAGSAALRVTMAATYDGAAVYAVLPRSETPNDSQLVRINTQNGVTQVIGRREEDGKAVDGDAATARWVQPALAGVDAAGNAYLIDSAPTTVFMPTGLIRKVSTDLKVTTIAGDITGREYGFRTGPMPGPMPNVDDVTVTAAGEVLYTFGNSLAMITAGN